MLTYFVVGLIVQIIIFIERFIRIPELYQFWWNSWKAWILFIVFMFINIALWPVSIICEIINVVRGE
jgi:hypothetical protein